MARLWKLRPVQLVTSEYAAQESRNNLPDLAQQLRLEQLLQSVERVNAALHPAPMAGVSLPEKDWPILHAAIVAQAQYLLTGDARHFGAYFGKTLSGVRVERPAEFLRQFLARHT